MLHFKSKDLLIEDRLRLATALAHEMACLVAVELSNCLEKIQEVLPVRGIQLRYQSRIDEDELRSETLFI